MTGSIGWLAAATIYFLGIHTLPSTPLRARLADRLGVGAYRGLFSLASAAGLVWMALAFRSTPPGDLMWEAGAAGRYLGLVLVALGFMLLVAGLTVPNPVAAGAEGALRRADAARGVLRITRHPAFWAFALWATAHLINNGDPAGVIFFGGLLVLALGGTRLIDARRQASAGEHWQRYLAATSNIPLLAIVQGRNQLKIGELWWRFLVGLVLFAGVLRIHLWLFGVSPLP